jgi:hypothetical protein
MNYRSISPIINNLTGKLGNAVYYGRPGSTRCIRRVYVDTMETPAQLAVRIKFKLVDRAFMALSQEKRKTWQAIATRRHRYTGYAYFMSVNLCRLHQGKEIITEVTQHG